MGMRMRMGVVDPFSLGNDKLGLVDPLEAAQLRRKLLKLLRWPPQRDQLHAQIMGQVHMHRRNDTIAMLVLNLDHLVGQMGPVVVEHQGQAGGDIPLLPLPRILGQFFPQELANGLASGSKFPLGAKGVKSLQQLRFKRDRKADDFSHSINPPQND